MKTLAKLVLRSGLTSAVLTAAFGCSASAFDQTAAGARDRAVEARADVANANARVNAADARGRAAEVDARAGVSAGSRKKGKAVIPSGTVLKISLIDAIGSGISSADDRFLANLAESVVINGATVLPKGTRVRGRVIKIRELIQLELTDIVQGNNRRVAITTRILEAITEEIHYHPETRLDFTLTNPVEL